MAEQHDKITFIPAGIAGVLRVRWMEPLCNDFRLISPLHSSTLGAIENMDVLKDSDIVVATLVYVDGTSGATKGMAIAGPAACGFAVLHRLQDQSLVLGGFFGALVVTDKRHRHYLGADKQTNGTAELSATTWAVLWALPSGYSDVAIGYDAKYAELMAVALGTPTTNH